MSSILDNILVNVSTSVYLNEYGIICGGKGDVEKLLSVPARTAVDTPLDSYIDPQYAHIAGMVIDQITQTGESRTIRLRMRHENSERELLFLPKDVSAVNWPSGAVVKFIDVSNFNEQISGTDLTVDVFTAMLQDFESSTILIDSKGRIVNLNSRAAALLGGSRGEHIDQWVDSLADTAPTETARRIFSKIRDVRKLHDYSQRPSLELSGGVTIFFNFYPITGGEGGETHLIVTLQNIVGGERANQRVGRVYEKLLHKIQVMSIHNSLANDFNVCSDGPQLYPRITRTLAIGLGIHDSISIFSLRNQKTNLFELASWFGTDEESAKALMVKPIGVAQHVFLPVRLHPNGEFMLKDGFTKMLYAPVIIQRKTIGYISIFRKSEQYQLKEEETLMRIVADNVRHFIVRWRAEVELNNKVETLSRLRSMSEAYQLCKNKEELAYSFLSSITAEEGVGLNRAFLLSYNQETNQLSGTLAVGPEDPEEAGRTWHELREQKVSFENLIKDFSRIPTVKSSPLHRRLINKKLACTGDTYICQAIRDGVVRVHHRADIQNDEERQLCAEIAAEEFLLAPLVNDGKPIGLLFADNAITREPITDDLISYVEIICNATKQNFERMSLYEKLKESVDKLQRSNQLLHEHQTRAQNLERLSAIGQMAAVVAHEIRNPLVTIGGFAKSLADDMSPEDPNSRFVNIIYDEVQRLERVVKDMLDYAKPVKMSLKEVFIRDVISQAIEILTPELEKTGVTVVSRLSRSGTPVKVDPNLMRQLLLNLMSNAQDAMPEGGTLRITSSFDSSSFRIRISDTGVGISPERKEKLFEPFYTSKQGGTGLGLSIVKNIVSQHGGSIDVKSKTGAGTTFTITIPLNPAQDYLRREDIRPPAANMGE